MNDLTVFYLRRARSRQQLYRAVSAVTRKILLVIGVYFLAGLLMQTVFAGIANADSKAASPFASRHGALWLHPSDQGRAYTEVLKMQTDVDIRIIGPIARATVKQQFRNDSAQWMEGLYVFPLPANAAVDRFRLVIGERIIEGRVKERGAARKIYTQAKAAGKKTGLVEQQRPNVFSTALANIAPGENIRVEIEYQQVLEYRDEHYRLRFPMTIGERYDPHAPGLPENQPAATFQTAVLRPKTGQDYRHDNDSSPPPVIPVDENRASNPTRIHILLDAGVSLEALDSPYHEINVNQTSESRYSIAKQGQNVVSDRDFELIWKPRLLNSPQLAAFRETVNGEGYTLLTVLPPEPGALQQRLQARDVVFVLDISGSMSGTSIAQARAALRDALGRLRPIDRFNIIWFNDKTGSAFPDFVRAEKKYLDFARGYVDRLQAGGGTEMLAALKQALANQLTYGRFRQVVFLTDGHISNETELFRIIDDRLGNSRLFTVGIGSAPNSYFMRKAAARGRGSFTYIGDVNEVREKTAKLFAKLENPALIDISLDIDHNRYEVFPAIIPDLYAGETARILIRGTPAPQSLRVRGNYAGSEWYSQAGPGDNDSNSDSLTGQSGIRVAWAREKIEALMTRYHERRNHSQREAIREAVIETAMAHHLVSRFTSLVAVDTTPANPGNRLQQQHLRNNRPHGWKPANTDRNPAALQLAMMQLPQTATGSRRLLLNALLLLVPALLLSIWLLQQERKQAKRTAGGRHCA